MTFNFDANTAFIFANAFEMVISISAAFILLAYAIGKIKSWQDMVRRFCKLLNRDFQGGPYDLAVAIMVIFIGKAIRTEAAWEWRFFEVELSLFRLFLGVLISSIGALCLIRVLSRHDRFNLMWICVSLAAFLFAAASAFSWR